MNEKDVQDNIAAGDGTRFDGVWRKSQAEKTQWMHVGRRLTMYVSGSAEAAISVHWRCYDS